MNRPLLLRAVEVDGVVTSVRVDRGRVVALGAAATQRGAAVVDGEGAALIPGLHDHHIHLAAIAAADRSISLAGRRLEDVLRAAATRSPGGQWLRAVGYDESTHGPVDRDRLDSVVPHRPLRVQHRSGAMWAVNSPALAELDPPEDLLGVERDAAGRATGRLFRLDDWLGERVPFEPPPDVAAVAARLASYGVTSVTDATPTAAVSGLALAGTANVSVRVTAMSAPGLQTTAYPSGIAPGAVKVVVPDHELPPFDSLVDAFAAARADRRAVAVHCVTAAALALAIAVWDEVGVHPGDRVEHGAVVLPGVAERLRHLGVTVVTQPAFVAAHGDRYLATVDPAEVPFLYPCATLLDAGVPVGGSTDAPYGPEDPWAAVVAAEDRLTAGGAVLGAVERVDARRALDLFLTDGPAPGGRPRRIIAGAPADLCLLDAPLAEALADPRSSRVRLTVCRGIVTHERAKG